MNGQTEKKNHAFSVTGRSEMQISGVKDVESFDEERVCLCTLCGDMTVEGGALHVGVLDMERGVVTLTGRVDAVYYANEEGAEKRSLLGKLFH